MEKILDLIEKELRDRKVRFTVDGELLELKVGSYPMRIQVDDVNTLQIWACEEGAYENDFFHEEYESEGKEFTEYEIKCHLDETLELYKSAVDKICEIETLFKKVSKIQEENNLSHELILSLYDAIISE